MHKCAYLTPMKMDLNWWIANVHSARMKISDGSPDLIVVTDASESGWGAVCEDEKIGGRWVS